MYANPRGACFFARYALERAVKTLYRLDPWLKKPYDTHLAALIHEPSFRNSLASGLFPKLKAIQKVGNRAAHSESKLTDADAFYVLQELHHFLYWLDKTYSEHPAGDQVFDGDKIPRTVMLDAQLDLNTAKKLKAHEQALKKQDQAATKKQAELEQSNQQLADEIAELRQKVAQTKAANEAAEQAAADSPLYSTLYSTLYSHDYNEAQTRKYLIDEYLREMGWDLSCADSVSHFSEEAKKAGVSFETEVEGMPNPSGTGFVDYVLWGEDHKPLAVVEAKRTRHSAKKGKRQAELYADCLEKQYGQRPLLYYTNGYDLYFWDDTLYPERQVQGYRTRNELQRLVDRRRNQLPIVKAPVDKAIAGRYYQIAALENIAEKFEHDRQRKTLLVMATGTGKTRTSVALVDLLLKNNWAKNVLFLADRNALVTQAKKAFARHLPRTSPTILSSGLTAAEVQSRMCFSTYPTMMNILSEPAASRLFGVGHFDLIIVDEAHRSVYKKYRSIFDYFDSLLVGLTATPKNDIDKNTYDIFELEAGVPTYAYELEEGIKDGYLTPPKCYSVPLKFMRKGVKKHKDLTPEEQEEWDEKEGLEGREEVLPSELNRFLFNTDTVDKMLEVLMREGIKVGGGDRLGKTIVFAANNDHAQFIQKRFDAQYPKWAGKFARVITYKNKEDYAETLIDEFKEVIVPSGKIPLNIALSVDMLDTGIDVPEVVNLVFFKVVQSKVKFLQMVGRGTRVCPELFGPNLTFDKKREKREKREKTNDKQFFKVFDYCQNFEFFEQKPEGAPDSSQKPLAQLIFEKRLELSHGLNKAEEESDLTLRAYVLDILHHQVAGMTLDNFIVRPKRESVEKYLKREIWDALTDEQYSEIINQIASLPTEADAINDDEADDELAKRFDHLLLHMQLEQLNTNVISETRRLRVVEAGERLEAKCSIPMVAAHLGLLQRIQTVEFWEHTTLSTLEEVRRTLRNLMQFLDKGDKVIVYTRFGDEYEGEIKEVPLPATSVGLEQYQKKVKVFVRENENQITIQRLKRGKAVTTQDLEQLETLLFEASGIEDKVRYQEVVHPKESVGVFIRSLVGLDQHAAKEAFAQHLNNAGLGSVQIEFINTLIDWLCQNGTMEPAALYDSPFIDFDDDSVYGLFPDEQAEAIVNTLIAVNDSAFPVEKDEAG